MKTLRPFVHSVFGATLLSLALPESAFAETKPQEGPPPKNWECYDVLVTVPPQRRYRYVGPHYPILTADSVTVGGGTKWDKQDGFNGTATTARSYISTIACSPERLADGSLSHVFAVAVAVPESVWGTSSLRRSEFPDVPGATSPIPMPQHAPGVEGQIVTAAQWDAGLAFAGFPGAIPQTGGAGRHFAEVFGPQARKAAVFWATGGTTGVATPLSDPDTLHLSFVSELERFECGRAAWFDLSGTMQTGLSGSLTDGSSDAPPAGLLDAFTFDLDRGTQVRSVSGIAGAIETGFPGTNRRTDGRSGAGAWLSGQNSGITLPDAPAFNIQGTDTGGDGTQGTTRGPGWSVCFSMMVPQSTAGTRAILDKTTARPWSNPDCQYAVELVDGLLRVTIGAPGFTEAQATHVVPNWQAVPGKWYDVCITTYRPVSAAGGPRTGFVYVDGEEKLSFDPGPMGVPNTQPLLIGRPRPGSVGPLPWIGVLDEILFFGRALTAAEVKNTHALHLEGHGYGLNRMQHTIHGGCTDCGRLPWEKATGSARLQAIVPAAVKRREFDEAGSDATLLHTFDHLPDGIVDAELVLRMKPAAAGSEDDTLQLGLLNALYQGQSGADWVCSLPVSSLNGVHAPWSFSPVMPWQDGTIQLSTLPASQNVLALMKTQRRLDIAVSDDTIVDSVELRLTLATGGRRPIAGGTCHIHPGLVTSEDPAQSLPYQVGLPAAATEPRYFEIGLPPQGARSMGLPFSWDGQGSFSAEVSTEVADTGGKPVHFTIPVVNPRSEITFSQGGTAGSAQTTIQLSPVAPTIPPPLGPGSSTASLGSIKLLSRGVMVREIPADGSQPLPPVSFTESLVTPTLVYDNLGWHVRTSVALASVTVQGQTIANVDEIILSTDQCGPVFDPNGWQRIAEFNVTLSPGTTLRYGGPRLGCGGGDGLAGSQLRQKVLVPRDGTIFDPWGPGGEMEDTAAKIRPVQLGNPAIASLNLGKLDSFHMEILPPLSSPGTPAYSPGDQIVTEVWGVSPAQPGVPHQLDRQTWEHIGVTPVIGETWRFTTDFSAIGSPQALFQALDGTQLVASGVLPGPVVYDGGFPDGAGKLGRASPCRAHTWTQRCWIKVPTGIATSTGSTTVQVTEVRVLALIAGSQEMLSRFDIVAPAAGFAIRNLSWTDPKGPPPPTLLIKPDQSVLLSWEPPGSGLLDGLPAAYRSSQLSGPWTPAGSTASGSIVLPPASPGTPGTAMRQFYLIDRGEAALARTPW